MVMVTLDDWSWLAGRLFAVGWHRWLVAGRGIVQLAYFVEGSCREMKEIVGVEVVLSCPPVECCDHMLKIKVGEIVL